MSEGTSIVWFRKDLRIEDNPALHSACKKFERVVPVYLHTPEEEKPWQLGGASQWWLHHSLESLQNDLEKIGLKLIVRSGSSLEILKELVSKTKASAIFWNRRYEPAIVKRDEKIKKELSKTLEVKSFNASLIFEPWEIKNKQDNPYQVFTAYWKACRAENKKIECTAKPKKNTGPTPRVKSLDIAELNLLPNIPWDEEFYKNWQPGSAGAKKNLKKFISSAIHNYDEDRNRPDLSHTSRLSPHLHWGEISPRQIWQEVEKNCKIKGSVETYLKEIVWREFAYHLLFFFPETTNKPLKRPFQNFPWKRSKKKLLAWQKGQTGYPIVDAGMRELWATGWMHNRVRMIVASFLVKHLLIPWQDGAAWFWDTLVDADLASNTLGWQWTAGCGADAAPYFRIFNPITQGEKFDINGDYVRKWVPEIAELPNQYLFKPWEATDIELSAAGIKLGTTYPRPIVDHNEARQAALAAYGEIKGS